MIPSVIRTLLNGQRPSLTEGSQLWDFLYIDDAVRALMLLLQSPQACGIFNLGSGHPVSVRAVVESIRDLIDPTLSLGFGEFPYPANQIMDLQPDLTCLKSATGWRAQVELAEGLRSTVE